jgi:ribosomal protein S27AE
MLLENFQDPRGEYKRICPYCLEPFIATHMNRFYCPEKNGVKNFCKHRQKRLVGELKESGIEIDRPERPPLKLLYEPSEKDFRNIDESSGEFK